MIPSREIGHDEVKNNGSCCAGGQLGSQVCGTEEKDASVYSSSTGVPHESTVDANAVSLTAAAMACPLVVVTGLCVPFLLTASVCVCLLRLMCWLVPLFAVKGVHFSTRAMHFPRGSVVAIVESQLGISC